MAQNNQHSDSETVTHPADEFFNDYYWGIESLLTAARHIGSWLNGACFYKARTGRRRWSGVTLLRLAAMDVRGEDLEEEDEEEWTGRGGWSGLTLLRDAMMVIQDENNLEDDDEEERTGRRRWSGLTLLRDATMMVIQDENNLEEEDHEEERTGRRRWSGVTLLRLAAMEVRGEDLEEEDEEDRTGRGGWSGLTLLRDAAMVVRGEENGRHERKWACKRKRSSEEGDGVDLAPVTKRRHMK